MERRYRGMVISFSAIVIVVIILVLIVQHQYKNGIKQEVYSVSTEIAQTVSNISTVKVPLYNKEASKVQNALKEIMNYTRASSIIIIDNNYKIYASMNEEEIGETIQIDTLPYNSGFDEAVYKDDDQYIAEYMSDIYDNGQVVGKIIVTTSSDIISPNMGSYIYYFNLMAVAILIMLMTTIVVQYLFFRKSSFQLSSNDIASMMAANDLMNNTFKAGIIVMDLEFNVVEINDEAKNIFELKKTEKGYRLGRSETILYKNLKQVINSNIPSYNVEYTTKNNQVVRCSLKGLYDYLGKQHGVIVLIRNSTEFSELAEELMGVKLLTDDLRAQNHEFLNKLHVISGLIQLGETDQVVNYISELTEEKQDLIGVLAKNISDVYVSGILLAKYSKAMEAKINFIIDPESNISKLPESIGVDRFCSIVGNLLENSIEELRGKEKGEIYIRITERLNEVSIVIRDNGGGIPEYIKKTIFDRGFTTKSGQRGYGLWLVREAIYDANGTIDFVSNSRGTRWHIVLH